MVDQHVKNVMLLSCPLLHGSRSLCFVRPLLFSIAWLKNLLCYNMILGSNITDRGVLVHSRGGNCPPAVYNHIIFYLVSYGRLSLLNNNNDFVICYIHYMLQHSTHTLRAFKHTFNSRSCKISTLPFTPFAIHVQSYTIDNAIK